MVALSVSAPIRYLEVERDEDVAEDGSTFLRQKGKARRYWCRMNRGIKNFRRRRRARKFIAMDAVSHDLEMGVRMETEEGSSHAA